MANALASWKDGGARRTITDFVDRVSKQGGPDFVPPAERIAVFDNDGTLWCEKPMPIELGFILMRLTSMGAERCLTSRAAAMESRCRERLRVARRGRHEALPRRR